MPWQLTDYPVLRQQSTPCATQGGSVSITCPTVAANQAWRVDGISVVCANSVTGQPVTLEIFDIAPATNVVPCQTTRLGNLDIDDQGSPITVRESNFLTFVFSNVDLGVIARIRVQYQLLQGVPGVSTPILGG